MLFTSDELEKIISRFGNSLLSGYGIKMSLSFGYNEVKTKGQSVIENWITEREKIINEWYRSTRDDIDNTFHHTNSHYLFHFLNSDSKVSSSIVVGIPHRLSIIILLLEARLTSLEEILVWLDEKENLILRKEIANQEQDVDTLYKITYSEHSRYIKLNNIVLTKTDFNSENDNAFQHIYLNANKTITKVEIEKAVGANLQKRLNDIVRDLGFTGNLRAIFFPAVTKTELMFINPITKQYALKNELPLIDFSKVGRQREIQ